MMQRLTCLIAILGMLACVRPAAAGIYDPENPALDVPTELPFEPQFRDRWAEIRRIGVMDSKEHKAATAALAALRQKADLSASDLVRRGILELRLGESDVALADLVQATRRD